MLWCIMDFRTDSRETLKFQTAERLDKYEE